MIIQEISIHMYLNVKIVQVTNKYKLSTINYLTEFIISSFFKQYK